MTDKIAPLMHRLKGNGQPWTVEEVIAALQNACDLLVESLKIATEYEKEVQTLKKQRIALLEALRSGENKVQ